jgi:hypothetical protein
VWAGFTWLASRPGSSRVVLHVPPFVRLGRTLAAGFGLLGVSVVRAAGQMDAAMRALAEAQRTAVTRVTVTRTADTSQLERALRDAEQRARAAGRRSRLR